MRPILFEPIPTYGDHMTRERFINDVASHCLIDYDGSGDLATETEASNVEIYPSTLSDPTFQWPVWATHVVWYNK